MSRPPHDRISIRIAPSSYGIDLLTVLGLILAISGSISATEWKSGLIATYSDGVNQATVVVPVPELGLATNESAHPAIAPAFTATYEGSLQIDLPGVYTLSGMDKIWLDGKEVEGPVQLKTGAHPLRIVYRRSAGPVSVGIVWQAGHFVQEPLPPTVLRHDAALAPAVVPIAQGGVPSPPFRTMQTMLAFKCGSCHDAGYLATMHHKHPPEALLRLIRHSGRKWHGAPMGPRLDASPELKQLVTDLGKLPRSNRERPKDAKPDPAMAEIVGTKAGLSCIACHDFGTHVALAESRGPNLLQMNERVTYDWFYRWMSNPGRMKPGVPMPAFYAHLPVAEQEKAIGKLWDYLAVGRKAPVPKELHVDPEVFRLKPAGQPMVMRTSMKLPDGRELLRAICVGFPSGMSFCFDAETCQLAYVWSGGFLDMAPHWQNQSGKPTPAIGKSVFLLPKNVGIGGASNPRFTGYDVSKAGPIFHFQIGVAQISLAITAGDNGEIIQHFRIENDVGGLFYLRGGDAPIHAKPAGEWQADRLAITEREFQIIIGGQAK